jgi:hypothetical protein
MKKYPGYSRAQITSIIKRGQNKAKNVNKRRCSICKSKTTRLKPQWNRRHLVDGTPYQPYPHWYSNGNNGGGGWLCFTCYQRKFMRQYYQKVIKKKRQEKLKNRKKKSLTA